MYRPRLISGLGEAAIPANFSWPTADEYTRHTATALNSVKAQGYAVMPTELVPVVDIAKPILTATAGGMHGVLSIAIETAVGKGLTAIAGEGVGSLAPKFINVVTDIFNGEASAAVSGAISLTGEVSSILSGFPIISEACGFIASVVGQMIDEANAIASLGERAIADCKEKLPGVCRSEVDYARYEATGSEGVTPSDMFRACLYAYRMQHSPSPNARLYSTVPGYWLPFSPASIYILLCGGETQGMGFDRATYESIMGVVRAKWGANIGIPQETQRTMWKLIKGILFSTQPPSYVIRSDITSIGDKGRSLFPILQDMVRNEFLRFERTGKGGWNEDMVRALSGALISTLGTWGVAQSQTQAHNVWCGCDSITDLTQPFMSAVGTWQIQLEEHFLKNGRYVFGGGQIKKKILASTKGVLALSKLQATNLVAAANPKGSKYTSSQKAAVAASAVGGSYLVWEIIRRIITKGI